MCSVDGCSLPPKSETMLLCKKHYMRNWRNGTTDLVRRKASSYEHSSGYIMVPALGHPLARGSSHAYAHRIAYYDAFGAGPFKCHWCAATVDWDGLHIDHLDDDKKNNVVSNLVPACPLCNQSRGRHKARRTWASKSGLTALGKTQTLNEWAAEIGISRSSILLRLSRGWSPDDAVSKPRGKFGPK